MKRKNLTNTYLSTLCLEMSMLLNAGITIQHGIGIMLDDEPDKNAQKVLQTLADKLDGGTPLSVAVTQSGYFPSYMGNMIEIGEKTGRLTETLKALSEHYQRQERLANSIRSAVTYPAILLGMMIVVVLILIVQVLPIFNDVLGRMGTQMSAFASRLMDFGNWFRGASIVIAVVTLSIFVIAFLIWVIPSIRNGIIKSFRKRFGAKGLFGRIAAFQFVSSLSLAVSSGLGVEDSIDLAASLNSDNETLSKKYDKCRTLLNEGSNLADALRESEILSVRDGRLLALGDQSGMADSTIAEIAKRSDTSIQDEIANVVGRIEPTLVITTSAIVGIILLSVMLPLIGIMTSIG
ncbi:MAG: type II secretion system F family protein [Defluviitaleaceae bacterium]|nr:type II secretion system F family protein [Defluviitaleaceae bacterium]